MRRWDRDAQRDDERAGPRAEPPTAQAVWPGSLAWASAVGNQAVQRVARTAVDEEVGEPPGVEEPAAAAEEPGLAAVEDLEELPG